MAGEIKRRDEIIEALKYADLKELFHEATDIRRAYVGEEVYLRGIIEISNYCVQECHYCGLNCNNHKIKRFRMGDDEIIAGAKDIMNAGIETIVIQSGEDSFYSTKNIVSLIKRIKDETGLIITLSLGEWPLDSFDAFREAGADRYLLKHETSDPVLYKSFRPDCDYSYRIKCIRYLKSIGCETGSGVMVGLPGQSLDSLADDILFFKDLDIDMIGIGPLIPHEETPLAGSKTGEPELVLKMIALARIVTQNTNIPATTAMTTIDPENRVRSLLAGANVIMPDFTPEKYRRLYEIYPGKGSGTAESSVIMESVRKDVEAAGRVIGKGPGNRKH